MTDSKGSAFRKKVREKQTINSSSNIQHRPMSLNIFCNNNMTNLISTETVLETLRF